MQRKPYGGKITAASITVAKLRWSRKRLCSLVLAANGRAIGNGLLDINVNLIHSGNGNASSSKNLGDAFRFVGLKMYGVVMRQ